jgi:hypothetical protein
MAVTGRGLTKVHALSGAARRTTGGMATAIVKRQR